MHFSKYRLVFLFCLAFIIVGSNASAFEDHTLVIEKNQKHFNTANRFALYSLSLQQLKGSSCANKIDISDHAEEDLRLIHSTFSEEENIFFSEDVIAIKESGHEEIESEIAHRIRTTGNIDNACHELESLYQASYKTAKEDFLQFIKAKTR